MMSSHCDEGVGLLRLHSKPHGILSIIYHTYKSLRLSITIPGLCGISPRPHPL